MLVPVPGTLHLGNRNQKGPPGQRSEDTHPSLSHSSWETQAQRTEGAAHMAQHFRGSSVSTAPS